MQNKRGLIVLIAIILAAIVVLILVYTIAFKESDEDQSSVLPVTDNETANATTPETPPEANLSGDSFPNSAEAHWTHMPLTYKIEDEEKCGTTVASLKEAFTIIQDSTDNIVRFEEDSGSPDIKFKCIDGEQEVKEQNDTVTCKDEIYDYDKIRIDPLREDLIVEGDFLLNATEVFRNLSTVFDNATNETTTELEVVYSICYIPSASVPDSLKELEPTKQENFILFSTINIYKPGKFSTSCSNFPAREVHTILHSFGFAHADVPGYDDYYGWADPNALRDIMFPDILCKFQTKIEDKYSSCLKNIYSNGAEGSCDGVNFAAT